MDTSTIIAFSMAVALGAAVIAVVVSWSVAHRAQAQRQQSADVRTKAVALDRRLREAERLAAEA